MGGGSQESNSSSRPLTGPERANIYNSALESLAGSAPGLVKKTVTPAQGDPYTRGGFGFNVPNPGYVPEKTSYALNAPEYAAPEYVSAGPAKTLSNGDYEALQQSLLKGNTAGLDYAKAQDTKNYNNSAATRGIWSSGLALQGENDISKGYAPQYAKAGSDATAQRYSLQNAENQGLNAYNQQEAGARNTFNSNNAQQTYNSKWAPLNYLSGIWNGTGGAVSNGSSGGFNFNL